MGGAIAAHLANYEKFPFNIACLSLMDVIETTALASLNVMKNVITARPKSFKSIEEAISWATSTRYIKNQKSATISMASQLKFDEQSKMFNWRTNLYDTSPYWKNWFTGMNNKFLSAKCGPKVLLIADANNLDKEMIIGQMQGKFQIQMLPSSGHAVHEDESENIAIKFSSYLNRFRIAESYKEGFKPLPKGIGTSNFKPNRLY